MPEARDDGLTGQAGISATLAGWVALLALVGSAWVIFRGSPADEPTHYLADREAALGTMSDLDRSFHVAAAEPQGFGLRFGGILIGVEKSDRATLGVPSIEADRHVRAAPEPFSGDNRQLLTEVLNDPFRTFISHIIEARLDRSVDIPYLRNRFLYDAYGDDPRRPSRALFAPPGDTPYERSWSALGELEAHIASQLAAAARAGRPYTHAVVATMGWDTAQDKAIRNINSIFGNLIIAADGRTDFKPLFIAISWPSRWDVPLVSFENKANDADEIGHVWANALLNRHLADLRAAASANTWPPFHVVAIGHSLGARLVTRAAFGGPALDPPSPIERGPDLVIGLQGAFSANRFLRHSPMGIEGAPYADYARLRGHIALTWSSSDLANQALKLGGVYYVGSAAGHDHVSEPEHRTHFRFVRAAADGAIEGALPRPGDPRRVLMIDASELIRYSVLDAAGGSHSDIYNAHMGRLLWTLIRELAPA